MHHHDSSPLDRSAMRIDREFAEKYSITKPEPTTHDVSILTSAANTKFTWTQEGVKAWAIRNRFEIVGCLWIGTMGGALFYNFSRGDISTAQKLINARMTAQSAALFGIISFGLVSNITERRRADNKD